MDLPHPVLGSLKSTGNPINLSRTPGRPTTVAPDLGQHSDEVLGELLGLGDDELAALRAAGVVG